MVLCKLALLGRYHAFEIPMIHASYVRAAWEVGRGNPGLLAQLIELEDGGEVLATRTLPLRG